MRTAFLKSIYVLAATFLSLSLSGIPVLAGSPAGGKDIPIPNSGFEEGEKGWTRGIQEGNYRLEIDSAVSHRGKKSAKIETIQGGWARWFRGIPVEKGNVYRVSVHVKGNHAGNTTLWIYGSGNDDRTMVTATPKWEKVSVEFVAQATGTLTCFLQLSPRESSAWGTVWFDDVTLEDISSSTPTALFNGTYWLSRPRYEIADPGLSGRVLAENASRGFVLYRRTDPRFFYPNSIPQPAEVIAGEVKASAAGRQNYAAAWLMVYALAGIKNLQVELAGDLVAENEAVISKENAAIKRIKFWPQRVGLAGTTYYEIPELLEANRPVDLRKGENQGFWVQVRLPKAVRAGRYDGTLVCRSADRKPVNVKLKLQIFPFDLETPKEIHWVNYPNDERWDGMTDAQVRRDIEEVREYGITGMVLEIFRGQQYSTKREADGKVRFADRRVGLYQKFRKELDMSGPLIIAPEKYLECTAGDLVGLKINGIDPKVGGQMDNQALKTAFKDSILAIDAVVKTTGSPGYNDWYYYGTDEPFAGFIQKSAWENRRAREVGVKTASTCYPDEALTTILPYLSADITHCAGTAEENLKRREVLRKAGCEYWFLGAGSYGGQEGGLMPNRYLAGFLFYKSGATASVHWTFQRTFGDPYNDFDGAGAAEPKDTCLTYPSRNRSKKQINVSTLQWEGIREGVDDYKYVHTLDCWIKRAKEKGLTAAADQAVKARDNILNAMPWGKDFNPGNCLAQPGTYNNDSADQTRMALAAEIMKLKMAVSKQ